MLVTRRLAHRSDNRIGSMVFVVLRAWIHWEHFVRLGILFFLLLFYATHVRTWCDPTTKFDVISHRSQQESTLHDEVRWSRNSKKNQTLYYTVSTKKYMRATTIGNFGGLLYVSTIIYDAKFQLIFRVKAKLSRQLDVSSAFCSGFEAHNNFCKSSESFFLWKGLYTVQWYQTAHFILV